MKRLLPSKRHFPGQVVLLGGILLGAACSKTGFLDKKPSTDLVVPSTLGDYRALLDNELLMAETPALGEVSADNYYLNFPFWQSLNTKEQMAYIWAADIYKGQGLVEDWDLPYKQAFYANVVLDGLPGISGDKSNAQEWNAVKGTALFIRAYAFYNIAQVFAPVYDSATAMKALGIPLRLSSDVQTKSVRATLRQTYDQILGDLLQANSLLPAAFPGKYRNRPSKSAVYAMLARVYLSMGAYSQAGLYADSSLQLYSSLMRYDTLNPANPLPFSRLNAEVLYQSHTLTNSQAIAGLVTPDCVVDSLLYRSYALNDLRAVLYYNLNSDSIHHNLNGTYNGSIFLFSGLATDEVYLIRAECEARMGNVTAAMQDLNKLLQNRFVTGTFVPYVAATWQQALALVLQERRKELAFRGLRWSDLRRLNKEGGNILCKRVLNGQAYQLAPNDLHYTLPIPPDVIAFTGMPQNPR